jgi:hypothetical protein
VLALFKTLATLRTDADVGTVESWRWSGPTAGFDAWCDRLGAEGLRRRAKQLATTREGRA